jgi:predicted ATPase/class 3 adenylate cyclase
LHDVTFLFTDIEGSTRLWEEQPERMRPALAAHDALVRETVERHHGHVVKMTGDGVHAAFEDALDAVEATLGLLRGMKDVAADIELRVRCGLHAGPSEGRDGDFFGSAVNRAARVMSAAHGGQALLSDAVVQRLEGRMPQRAALRDLGPVRLRDLARPERLYQLAHPELRETFPALRSLEGTPNNLPLQLSSFVGREREVAELAALLERNRLVTVVGLGGLGKTRLALQTAAELLESHAEGAWLVELAPITDPARVMEAIATMLGVKEEAGASIDEVLARFLRDRSLLVLLDNCEHVLEGAATAAKRLLAMGAGVRLLATSREPLRLSGEALFPLGGLLVPGPREALSAEAVARYESTRLFIERASAAAPDFVLDGDNASLVAAICHRLDGIPLAIELAAARVRSVSLAQIAARLKDRFRLLTSGDPTALPRQKTLYATIDWSHALLPEEERALLRRLAVFAGGCTLESAEAVCGDGETDGTPDVLDLLGRLVDKSLVGFDDRTGRYTLLETVREYALRKLVELDELGRYRQRHFEHFVATAVASRSGPAEGREAEWLSRMDHDRDNFVAAHHWAGEAADGQAGLAMLNALKPYWWGQGLLRLAESLLTEALARPGAAARTRVRAQSLFIAGQLRSFMGRHRDAIAPLEESLAIARELEDPRGISTVCQTLGAAETAAGQYARARDHFEEAASIALASGDERALAAALSGRVQLHRVEQQLTEAAALAAECIRLGESTGEGTIRVNGLLNAAMIALDLGRAREARDAARILASDAASLRHLTAKAGLLDVALGLSAHAHEWARVALLWGASEAMAEETGYRRDTADDGFVSPRVAKARAALGPGFDEAAAQGRALRAEDALAHAVESVGATALARA